MLHLSWRLPALLLVLCLAACASPTEDADDADEAIASTQEALTYSPPACGASCVNDGTLAAMNAAALKYGFPRWFVYTTVHRESSFNPKAQNWTGSNECDTGYGLTQITCPHHEGLSFPNGLANPDQSNADWQGDMRIKAFCSETGLCPWINMADVTKLATGSDRFHPTKNLDRYFSGYAAPAFYLEAKRAPKQSGETTAAFHNRVLRRVAWHWRYGHYASFTYPTDPGGYFSGSGVYRWDNYAATYRAAVEAVDGVWDGNVCKPPYSASGCGGKTTTSPSGNAKYDFEGSAQAWTHSGSGLIGSISASTARASSGSSSLAIALTGGTGTRSVSVSDGALPTAGKTVSLRLWIPSGSKISWVQPYVKEGAAGNWRWTATTTTASQLTPGAWNTLTVTVPPDAAAVASIGVQIGVSSSWTGTAYLDAVTW